MTHANNSKSKKTDPRNYDGVIDHAQSEREVEVLYQRLGNRWFAFSMIDDEIYMGSLTPDEITGANPQSNGNKNSK